MFVILILILVILVLVFLPRLCLHYKWRKIRRLAKSKGYKLVLISEKQKKKGRPLPRGGVLYQSGDEICVRYKVISLKEAEGFIRKVG